MYKTAREAIFNSRTAGKSTKCEATMDNYGELVEVCSDRRLQDDGSIVFSCAERGDDWTVIMERRPW
jgi:hypothetical protein